MRQSSAVIVPLLLGLASAAHAVPHYYNPVPYQVDEEKFPYVIYPSSYQLDDKIPWESSYPFEPGLDYLPWEQAQIIQEEVTLTAGKPATDNAGVPVITVDQGAISESSLAIAPPAIEILPAEDGMQGQSSSYAKSYSRKQGFGNDNFGAGYAIDANITVIEAVGAEAKQVDASADGRVYATAFRHQEDIVRGRAQIHGQSGQRNSGTAAMYVLGQEVWSGNLAFKFSITPLNWSRNFFDVQQRFMVGPVPVAVTAALAGGVKLSADGEIDATVAKLTTTPGGYTSVTASAAVDVVIAAFGVEGNLMLINVMLPAAGAVDWPQCTLNWSLKTNLALNTLSGSIDLFARIKFLFFEKKWLLNIAKWSGLTYSLQLVDASGVRELGVCGFDRTLANSEGYESLRL